MRNGMNEAGRRSRTTGAVAAALLVSGLLVVGAHSTSAATNKTINANCRGADAKSQQLMEVGLKAPSLDVPFNSSVDAPPFVTPGQSDVPVSITYSLNLPASLVNTAAGLGVTALDVKNAKADVAVSGPTSTTGFPGTFPNQTITLVKDQPLVSTFPAITGELDDVGQGGIIKLISQKVDFTIELSLGGPQTINMTCATGATLASIPVKVAGSPDIKQPIEVGPSASPITVDVLGQYVTNGTDKSGTVRPVDPSTLKVIEGPGTIQAGKVVVTPPATGQADVTFEVCAGTVEVAPATEGISEVQKIRLFNEWQNPGKREIATTFGIGDATATQALWHLGPTLLPSSGPIPAAWQDNFFPYAVGSGHEWPSAAAMAAAIGAIPGVGAGNVEVTVDTPPKALEGSAYSYLDYTVTFTGERANSAIDQVSVKQMASIFPREWLDAITDLATELIPAPGEGGGGGPEGVPPGMTVQEYLDQLGAEIDAANANGDFLTAFAKFNEYLTVAFSNLMDLIDVEAILGFINSLFQKPADISTVTQGEDPQAAQMQELCSQGIITVKGATVASSTTIKVDDTTKPNNPGQRGGTGLGIAG